MNLRICLLNSTVFAVAALTAVGCNNREELAPYAFLGADCTNIPNGQVGVSYSYTPDYRGGNGNVMYEASGLPDGLSIDPNTGEISGVPLEEGDFEVVITVTDGTGISQSISCGTLTIDPANVLTFDCDSNAPAIAVQGVSYTHTFTAVGGSEPYTWSAADLPADLMLDPSTGTISGVANVDEGDYIISVEVTDSSDPEQTATCPLTLTVNPSLQVDPDVLGGKGDCLAVGSATDLDTLLGDGTLFGGDGTPLSCAFQEYDPDGDPGVGFRGHGALPPGIGVDDRCVSSGSVNPAEPLGVYAFIMTVTQEGSGQRVYLPFCATQEVPHPPAYDISVTNGGNDWGFAPGVVSPSNNSISFGAPGDPEVSVERPCNNSSCFYKYYFGFNALNGGVSGEPSNTIPGPNGFTHSVGINDTIDADSGLRGRYWVANIRWDYCLFGSDAPDADDQNEALCGSKDLAQQNGDDSNLMYSVVIRPE